MRQWIVKRLEAMSASELYAVMQARADVFVREQKIFFIPMPTAKISAACTFTLRMRSEKYWLICGCFKRMRWETFVLAGCLPL